MDYWCYALINRRLGEIYFTRKRGEVAIKGHCYLNPKEHLTKGEAATLQHDISLNQFAYYRRSYRRKA